MHAWAVFFAYGVGMGIAFALNSWYVFPKSDKTGSQAGAGLPGDQPSIFASGMDCVITFKAVVDRAGRHAPPRRDRPCHCNHAASYGYFPLL